VLGPLALLSAFTVTVPASADTKACVEASDKGQALRDDGKLRPSREEFLKCAAPQCPSVVRNECSRWVAEVDARIPTVVFGVHDPRGNDIGVVKIAMDGVEIANRADGRAVSVDPGEHKFKFDAAEGQVERSFVVREGEKARVLSVTLQAPRSEATQTASIVPPVVNAPPPDTTQRASSVPTGTFIFGGLSLVAFAGFGYFWVSAVDEAKNLRDTCTPNCATADTSPAMTKALIADVSLGVGIASALTAAGFYVFGRSDSADRPKASLDVSPVAGGATMRVLGTF